MDELWLLYPAFALATLATLFFTQISIRNSKRRIKDLEAAAEAIKAHYNALEDFLDDDNVPDIIKTAAFTFHRSVTDRQSAFEVANLVCSDEVIETTPAMDEFDSVLEELRDQNKPAYDTYRIVISSGLAAMLLRWPETSGVFARAAFEAALKNDREQMIANAIVDRSRKDNHNGNHFGGGLAHA